MPTPIQVIIVEDRPADAELILAELRRAGFDPHWVRTDSERDFVTHLDPAPDVILADYNLPRFDARRALQILQERSLDIPLIIVSGTIGEDIAVSLMKEGTADYLFKDRLARLGPAVDGALKEKQIRDARRRAEAALRESEQRLALIYESVADVIFLIAVEPNDIFRFVSINAAFQSATGLAREQVVGKRIDEIIPEPSRTLVLNNYRTAIRERRRVDWEEVSVYPTGRKVGEVTVVPVFDASGTCHHLIGAVHDVTENRQMQESLQARSDEIRLMSQQLWQAGKLATVGELAASIAHELNNPLATVSLHLESLSAQLARAPQQRSLEVMAQEVERMSSLVADLLEFSRRRQPQISTIDVREEIVRTLELVSYYLRNRHINVAQEFASDVPLIQADRQLLRQLFLNLLTNASDAMPEGGRLTIRVHAAPAKVAIEITDTGVGIAPEDLPKMTEPFFTTKEPGKGTGLGLAICRRIVEEHHGTLNFASEVGKGTTVRVTLPVANSKNATHLSEPPG